MAEEATDEDIPKEWGWPEKPFDIEILKEHVLAYTKETQQELWDAQLEARAADSTLENHMEERVFANVLLNKEGTGADREGRDGIDPNAYLKGKWYRFLNAKGNCYVYVHNYTKDVTATRPDNFKDLTDEEKKRLAKFGVFVKELPQTLERIYDTDKAIPIVYASEQTCEALKSFFIYDKGGQLLDATKLKRINAKGLEDARQAIVNAMKWGKMLCVYMGDHICDFIEKICVSKNKDTFPIALFRHGAMDSDMVKEKIWREEDKEEGQLICRPGFRVCLLLMYDTLNYEMSSMRKEELPAKIPDFQYMKEVKTYSEEDKAKLLDAMRA
mmetsp:Transcript_47891/g.113816  ORF Transcript_47891/g.113816 Transcript_47891/m.113816 type:complete len:328 (-) Transcript_47891:59-1042(-)